MMRGGNGKRRYDIRHGPFDILGGGGGGLGIFFRAKNFFRTILEQDYFFRRPFGPDYFFYKPKLSYNIHV